MIYRNQRHAYTYASAITERCTTALPPVQPAVRKVDVLGLKFLSWKCSQAFHSDSLFHIESIYSAVHTCFNAWSTLYLPGIVFHTNTKRLTPKTLIISIPCTLIFQTNKKKTKTRYRIERLLAIATCKHFSCLIWFEILKYAAHEYSCRLRF